MHSLTRLCAIWNAATAPYVPRTTAGHRAASKLARKIMRLIKAHPDAAAIQELSDGSLYVVR